MVPEVPDAGENVNDPGQSRGMALAFACERRPVLSHAGRDFLSDLCDRNHRSGIAYSSLERKGSESIDALWVGPVSFPWRGQAFLGGVLSVLLSSVLARVALCERKGQAMSYLWSDFVPLERNNARALQLSKGLAKPPNQPVGSGFESRREHHV